MQQIFDDLTEETKNNYPIEEDDSFTPDQVDEINEYKELAKRKIAKNDSVLRGIETFFWGISSYSLCKWLVLSLGSNGISLAIALALVINQIVNRDCLDSFNINRVDGQWETKGMDKMFKFLFGLGTSAFVAWASIGNFVGMVHDSQITYGIINNKIEEFNSYSKKQRDDFLEGVAIGASVVAFFVVLSKISKS
jgi:hypothetical protein